MEIECATDVYVLCYIGNIGFNILVYSPTHRQPCTTKGRKEKKGKKSKEKKKNVTLKGFNNISSMAQRISDPADAKFTKEKK